MVGHQGGELHYGKDFYPKAFEKLLGRPLDLPGEEEPAAVEELAAGEEAPLG